MRKFVSATSIVTQNVLKSLRCQRLCLCSHQIKTRGLKAKEYEDYSLNLNHKICFYDNGGKYNFKKFEKIKK